MRHQDSLLVNEDAVRQKIELSPLERFVKYDKFPWSLIIFICLLVFTTLQVISTAQNGANYQKPILRAFKEALLNDTEQDFHKTFYTLRDFQDHLQDITDVLDDFDSNCMNKVDTKATKYVIDVYYTNPPLHLQTDDSGRTKLNVTGKYSFPIKDIKDGIKEPFDPDDLGELKVETFNLKITNLYTSSQAMSSQTLCFNWTIIISYEFVATAHIEAGLDAQYTYCSADYDGFDDDDDDKTPDPKPKPEDESEDEKDKEPEPKEDGDKDEETDTDTEAKQEDEKDSEPKEKPKQESEKEINTEAEKDSKSKADEVIKAETAALRSHAPFGNTLYAVHLLVLIFAFASFISGWYYVYEIGLLQMASRHAKHMHSPIFSFEQEEDGKKAIESNWNNLSFIEKMKFFDVFFYVMMIGNVFQIFGSIVAIYQNLVQTNTNILLGIRQGCIGFGCLCTWFCLIKYFTENKQFKTTTNLLAQSTIAVLKFCVGVIPVYLAFTFLGRCLFWRTEKFESTQHAFVALFSILAGDILDETYEDTEADGVLSVVFITIWIILFMSSVHNMFISIISNGFRNKFLEERYQELFELYSLGDREAVSKWKINEKEIMAENFGKQKKEDKEEDIMGWMPYVRRGDSNVDFQLEGREKLKRIEIEKNDMRENILERTEELEKILTDMKEIADEFCAVSKDKNEKIIVKNSFAKCLKDLHLYIRTELSVSPLRDKRSVDLSPEREEPEVPSRRSESEIHYRGPKIE